MQDSSKFFKQHPKYGKQHLMAENSYHLREMIEQCSRCSLPTGSGTSDQKSENVKSSVTPMPTNDPIFVMIRFIKTPLHYEKLRTGVTPLRSYRNFIVGPTGPKNKEVQKNRTFLEWRWFICELAPSGYERFFYRKWANITWALARYGHKSITWISYQWRMDCNSWFW